MAGTWAEVRPDGSCICRWWVTCAPGGKWARTPHPQCPATHRDDVPDQDGGRR